MKERRKKVLIYQRYYNAKGKEIPKIQYDKLEYLNK